MSEKNEIIDNNQAIDKNFKQSNLLPSEKKETEDVDIEQLIPDLPKFEKNYENKDMNLFKDDILNYLKDRDKCIFGLIKKYQEKIEKTESNYSELTKRISNNYSDILSSQAGINNRLDKLNSYESFSTKTNDQLISHEIRINNLREDFHKSVQKYDKIYLDNLELPGYIGKYSKYKNCQVFFEEVIKELNKLNAYKEKNTLDLKAYKEKLELNIKTFNSLVDNNNKSQIKYINDMFEKNYKECKSMIETVEERITDMRIENSRYAVELIGKSINLTKEWDKIQNIKEEIMHEFNDKIHEFRIVSNNTINSFSEFKSEFILIKRKFFELAEFIKDVRFRKNIGGDVKKKEIKCIAKKITGKKACGKSIDKDKEKILLEYNFKNEKNDLRKSVSQEPGGKIKNYIKGVTNVEELKQDSKVHNHNLSSERIKKLKIETKNNINSVNRRKQKNYTVVAGVHIHCQAVIAGRQRDALRDGCGHHASVPHAEDVRAVSGLRIASSAPHVDAPPSRVADDRPADGRHLVEGAAVGFKAGVGDICGGHIHAIGILAYGQVFGQYVVFVVDFLVAVEADVADGSAISIESGETRCRHQLPVGITTVQCDFLSRVVPEPVENAVDAFHIPYIILTPAVGTDVGGRHLPVVVSVYPPEVGGSVCRR